MNSNKLKNFLLLAFLLQIFVFPAYSADNQKLLRIANKKLSSWYNPFSQWDHMGKPAIDSVRIDIKAGELLVFFNADLSYFPFREDSYLEFTGSLRNALGRQFRKYGIEVFTSGYNLSQLIPNVFRTTMMIDSGRMRKENPSGNQLVERIVPYALKEGLQDNSIALWPSHGYYYEMSLDRWEFQRAKLFGTVEDISVMGIVVPYLAPMLENAGANVFMPRERDLQTSEIIVDNDLSDANSKVVIQLPESKEIFPGFLKCDTIFTGDNPFLKGTSVRTDADSVTYIPEIPLRGSYAVYISYPALPDNSTEVTYSVIHSGGRTDFVVNQTMGGGTWIYLGTFEFNQGFDPAAGAVTVSAANGGKIAVDAVKFGGGMGNVARKPSGEMIRNQQSAISTSPPAAVSVPVSSDRYRWKTSGMPRYLEGSRYYLQFAGMPDSLCYSPTGGKNDYNDDYMSRGLWVNYLAAEPVPDDNGFLKGGLGIPVDLAFGFHTDAGVTPDDSVIGTLAIYSTASGNRLFPDNTSRLASRDLADIIQTQVVDDIRKQFDPQWTRRGLWDKPYAEARRPDVPAILLELLSHQNLADLYFGLDPRFRFAVSRSAYLGILKYLAFTEGRNYTVQPLPVKEFAIEFSGGKKVRLSWQPPPVNDDPTAVPEGYLLFMREGENGFGNGRLVSGTSVETELENYNTIYGFKVRAFNKGGESFDSEILSVGITEDDNNPVLVVNGFDRVCGPAWTDNSAMAGVAAWNDRGVPYKYDFITIGDQYDFDRSSPWLDDDAPGWGATYSDLAGQIVAGNTFDFPYIHGRAIMAAGHSFVSVSDEYFESEALSPSKYKTVDIILGEEKSTNSLAGPSVKEFKIYTAGFMRKVSDMAESGANIFMSGAYVGTDLDINGDSTDIDFASNILHFRHMTGHAVRTGGVYPTDNAGSSFSSDFSFNTAPSGIIYQVEAPDAIEPTGKGSLTAFRYSESSASAGVLYSGRHKTVVLGFPFETIESEEDRYELMKEILTFFNKK